MSDPEIPSDDSKPDEEKSTLPGGIAPPPPPKPDIQDNAKSGPTYRTEDSGKKKRKRRGKQEKRQHPLDAYEPLRKRKGCAGCGCFLLVAAGLFAALVLAVAYLGPGRFAMEGYEVVRLEAEQAIITEAPEGPTYYLGMEIDYRVPRTEVPIAIAGTTVKLSGDFFEDVSATGSKVIGTSGARFSRNLEVYAVEFIDEGLTLKGVLRGSVMQNAQ